VAWHYCVDRDLTPTWLGPADAAKAHRIGRFEVTDQRGETVTQEALDGRVSIVSFIFTTCGGVCPVVVSNLKPVQDAFRAEPAVRMLSFSVHPDSDTREVLARYAAKRGIDSDTWRLLTGKRAEIYELARRSFFAESDILAELGPDDFLHTELVYLIDGERRIRGVYNGMLALDMQRLIADAGALSARSQL